MEHIKYDGNYLASMERMVEERMKPQHFTLTPLEMLALINLNRESRVDEKDGE